MRRKIGCLLIFALLLCSIEIQPRALALGVDSNVRIGLAYSSNAKPTANLQNVTGLGAGYAYGYFDKNTGTFVNLFDSADVEITILKDANIYIGSGNSYSEAAISGAPQIGAYHLQYDTVYYSANEAQNACNQLAAHNYMAFPAYINGQYRVRVGAYLTKDDAERDRNSVSAAALDSLTVCGGSETSYTVTKTGEAKIIFELDSAAAPLGVMPKASGKAQTWSRGEKYYGGFEYNRIDGGNLTVINVVNINDYLKGVVPYEMSASWPIEALKAQALCAKSYCLNSAGKHKKQGFDLCNTTDCQVYFGTRSADARSDSAVDATYGISVTYNGALAQTYYHASSGGWTEDSENIWGSSIPYLRAVEDKYLTHIEAWSAQLSAEKIAEILRNKGIDVDNVTDLYVSKLTAAGNVREITIERSNGSPLVYSGEKVRTILNPSGTVYVRSQRYTITKSGSGSSTGGASDIYVNGEQLQGTIDSNYAVNSGAVPTKISSGSHYAVSSGGTSLLSEGTSSGGTDTGELTFKIAGTGNGHHIGLSQWGAHDMAEQGFSYVDIIKFYFTGVDVG